MYILSFFFKYLVLIKSEIWGIYLNFAPDGIYSTSIIHIRNKIQLNINLTGYFFSVNFTY